MTAAQFEQKQAEMSNEELIELADKQVSKLAETGGSSHKMSVPPQITDTDMIFCELIKRFKAVLQEVENQLYTAEDIEAFAEWTAFMQWIYDPTDKCWFQKHLSETKTTTKLRELWEQERKKESCDKVEFLKSANEPSEVTHPYDLSKK